MVRDLTRQENVEMSIKHYLKNMHRMASQFKPTTYKELHRQRLYMKDIDCPEAWHRYLQNFLPPGVFYLNESTGVVDGPGALEEEAGPSGYKGKGKGVAPAADLMSSLPASMRAENLMCYIGHEGTYTPAHREMCATLGQNLMVETSGSGLDPWGMPERPGSSIWFMTETKERHIVSEYWMSVLGHDIEVESYFAQVNAWKNAPFTTYIVEQKAGDFILIPPMAPHQVWNRGTRTMKVAWNRTTVETLDLALKEALPRARMVCRDEQYKCKAIIYFTLMKYFDLLRRVDANRGGGLSTAALAKINADRKVRQLRRDFQRLFRLFAKIILSEMFAPDLPQGNVQFLPFESNVTCAYCRCNIFNRFLTCPTCVTQLEDGEQDAYDVCMECYAMGRSCGCLSNLQWVEQFRWKDLVDRHDEWRRLVIDMEGGVRYDSPQTLDEARKRWGRKTLAQVCQEQLKIRPWRDITKPPPSKAEEQGIEAEEDDDDDVDLDRWGRKKARRRRRSEQWLKDNVNCHICKKREPTWKLVRCGCGISYCYGVLFRAFDLMPLDVMENPNWQCPRCLDICSCAQCLRDGKSSNPYEPHGTLVGHDTKHVADPRSVESLVDFSRGNLIWIRKGSQEEETEDDEQYESRRLRKLIAQADREKAQEEDWREIFVEGEPAPAAMTDAPHEMDDGQHNEMAVDPALATDSASQTQHDVVMTEDVPEHDSPTESAPQKWARTYATTTAGQIHTALPSPSAMLGGAPPTEGSAPLGLRTDDSHPDDHEPSMAIEEEELTQLERDPHGFMVSAGLTGQSVHSYEYPARFVVPTETMINPGNKGKDAGHGSTSFSTSETPARSTFGQRLPWRKTAGGKRKRQKGGDAVDSDVPKPGMQDANREYEQARLQKTLADAKKNDSLTMTQARLNKQQKILKLPVQVSQLAQVQGDQREEEMKDVDDEGPQPSVGARSHFGGDGAGDDDFDEPVVVRSDVPKRSKLTQISTALNKARVEAGKRLFGPRKRGRPRKIRAAEDVNQSPAPASTVHAEGPESLKKTSRKRQSAPNAVTDLGVGRSTRSRWQSLGKAPKQLFEQPSPSKASLASGRKTRPSLPKGPSRSDNEEDIEFEEVDDNHVPIRASTLQAASKKNIDKPRSPLAKGTPLSDDEENIEFEEVDDNHVPIRTSIMQVNSEKNRHHPLSKGASPSDDDDEDIEFEEVDDDYVPIKAGLMRATPKKNASVM